MGSFWALSIPRSSIIFHQPAALACLLINMNIQRIFCRIYMQNIQRVFCKIYKGHSFFMNSDTVFVFRCQCWEQNCLFLFKHLNIYKSSCTDWATGMEALLSYSSGIYPAYQSQAIMRARSYYIVWVIWTKKTSPNVTFQSFVLQSSAWFSNQAVSLCSCNSAHKNLWWPTKCKIRRKQDPNLRK